jgi:hypothetical protein
MAAEDPSEGGSRPTNLKDSVTPAEPGNPADSERELPTTAERVAESHEKYPDRCSLPLSARHGTSLRIEYTRDTWESWTSETVDDLDDEATGQSLVRRSAVSWGEAVELMLENHEETRRTTVNLEKGRPGDPEHTEFSIDAVTRWFSKYQKKYYAQMEGWLREMTGGERPSGGETAGELENPYICLVTLSASSIPNGEHVPPVDHVNVRRESWSSVYDTMRNTMRSLGFDWQYDRRSEPHTGKRGEYGINRCYGHDHVVLLVDGDVSPGDLRPIVETHVEKCEWAGPDAHDLDVADWDANRNDVDTIEIKEPDELNNVASYVADYVSIDPLDLHERSTEYVMWAASVTAANAKTQSRSDAAGWASTADACKQRFESGKSDQSVDHGESIVRSDTRGVELECAECGSPHGIDQDQTLTAARVSTDSPAAADGGLDREGELRDRWPSAKAGSYVGQTPEEKRQRDRIERYIEANPDASPSQILGALGLPPDARRLIDEIDAGVDPAEPVSFDRPPEWRVTSVIVGNDEYPASAGTGVELVDVIDPVINLLNETKLGCEKADSILWKCDRTGVTMWGGKQMAHYLIKHGIRHPHVVDHVVSALRVPNENSTGTIPAS